VTDFSEFSAEADDPLPETSQKRMYKPSAKKIQMDEPAQSSKQQKMVLTDDLLTFLGEIIQGDPDSWGIMLTKSRGKGKVRLKSIQHLAKHTNPLTQGKTSTVETVTKWINAGIELAEKEAARRADGGVAGRQIQQRASPSKTYEDRVSGCNRHHRQVSSYGYVHGRRSRAQQAGSFAHQRFAYLNKERCEQGSCTSMLARARAGARARARQRAHADTAKRSCGCI
jgi:hypothetical protein